jgi:lipopolysaccharide transport system ATP-binding protein
VRGNPLERESPELSLDRVGVAYWRKEGYFRRSPFWALEDVSLEVRTGETLGIIGRNGSGKSTLMKILAGIIKPDRGEFRPAPGRASLLSLQLGFVRYLSGRENAYLSGMLLGLTRAEVRDRIDEIIEFSELGKFFDQPIFSYSSGMLARLGFAVALTANPEVLLIDEIWGVGDASFREKSAARMRERALSDKTVVIVSHNTELFERFCNRVVWMDAGHTKAIGKPEEIIERYEAAT